ncbi:MAG: hypothetical protein PHU25_02750 [Deltaproteobacteria bacterium]|nr:hypothetical protein [Deltaproteobacteria bacterium]
MRRLVSVLVAFAALSGAAFGCDGGKGDGALASFSGSECKKDGYEGLLMPLLTLPSSGGYDGLQCISWKRAADGTLEVDLVNFPGACGARYEGEAALENAHTLRLAALNPSCEIASCGSCIYDWSYEVEGVAADADLKLVMEENACPDGEEGARVDEATIPKARLSAGIMCRYVDSGVMEWVAGCGALHLPCGTGSGMCPEEPVPCQGDLVCNATGVGSDEVCMQPCSTSSQCPLPDVLTCDGEVCRLTETW